MGDDLYTVGNIYIFFMCKKRDFVKKEGLRSDWDYKRNRDYWGVDIIRGEFWGILVFEGLMEEEYWVKKIGNW